MPAIRFEFYPRELTEIVVAALKERLAYDIDPKHIRFVEYPEPNGEGKIGVLYDNSFIPVDAGASDNDRRPI